MTDLQRDFIGRYLYETSEIVNSLDINDILKVSERLKRVKRLFILGVGGSAGTASHAVNDFRKIAGIEAYAPTDNVSELTARVNDDGWETVFAEWLKTSHLSEHDGILIFSVGGGNKEKNISVNLINAIGYAKSVGATVMGVVGRDGGYTALHADACVIVPIANPDTITAHTE
jgi:D-sedoheptulose 7-phosphate isomerase